MTSSFVKLKRYILCNFIVILLPIKSFVAVFEAVLIASVVDYSAW